VKAAAALENNPESILSTNSTILRFPEGLIGFGECRNFVLIEEADIVPFRRLQSTDRIDVGFFVLDPQYIRQNYLSLVSGRDWESVGLENPASRMVLVICRLGSTLSQASANFLAPLLINDATRTGRQVVMSNEFLSYRQPLFRASRSSGS
jgi:flagellar assembly factor FliW